MGIYIRKKTKEEYATISMEWRKNNPEAVKAINKRWYENNKEFIKLKKKIKSGEIIEI